MRNFPANTSKPLFPSSPARKFVSSAVSSVTIKYTIYFIKYGNGLRWNPCLNSTTGSIQTSVVSMLTVVPINAPMSPKVLAVKMEMPILTAAEMIGINFPSSKTPIVSRNVVFTLRIPTR